MTPLEHALYLARHHIPVFPCNADKTPRTASGFKDASTDKRQIQRWWGPSPDALIGVPTGIRFDVLDIDPKHPQSVEWLARAQLPPTRSHRTRSNGYHFLFRPSAKIRNSVSKIDTGVDVRAKGGYIIWWPAVGLEVEEPDLLAAWPETIVSQLTADVEVDRPLPPQERPPIGAGDPFYYVYKYRADELIQGILQRARDALPGCRQLIYWQCSRDLLKIVDQSLLDKDDALSLLFEAAMCSADPGTEVGVLQAIRCLR